MFSLSSIKEKKENDRMIHNIPAKLLQNSEYVVKLKKEHLKLLMNQ